jgi:putative ABC transport system permease protein
MENYQQRIPNPMIKNFFKLAVRSLLKNKIYSLINIFGLAMGIAICLLIVLFIQGELGYDNFHERGDRIYRVVADRIYPGRVAAFTPIPNSFGAAFQHEFPEIEECTRVFEEEGQGVKVRAGTHTFEEKELFSADSNFFRVFTGRFLEGDSTALQTPGAVVVNEATAKRWFGSASNAIGKSVEMRGRTLRLTAVCKDWPEKSHLLFNVLIADMGTEDDRYRSFTGFSAYTYLLLRPHASPEALEAKFPGAVEKYVAGEIEQAFGMSYQQFRASGNGYHYFLQPLTKIHLISNRENELGPNGSIKEVWLFGMIALFILGIACINFVNLSTARSVERAKEVGLRKTFGSVRLELVQQFLMESVLMSLLSMMIAIGLIVILVPVFNQITGKELSAHWFAGLLPVLGLLIFAVFIGCVAGLYPAFVLSSFKPVLVLKGKFTANRYGTALRNGLVVFQFSISIVLIISTIIVRRQMQYMLGDRLGFKMDNILVVQGAGELGPHTKAFKDELGRMPGVESVSGSLFLPGDTFLSDPFQLVGSKESHTERASVVDARFAGLLGLQLKEGRFFSDDFSMDSLSLVLNERAVVVLQLQHPLGARMNVLQAGLNGPPGSPLKVFTVVGVLKDFHFLSLRQKISPLIFRNQRYGDPSPLIAIRIKGSAMGGAISSIEKTWRGMVPDWPFRYTFLDQHLADQYRAEQTAQKVFTSFSILTIFIACIGLLGLAAYTTRQRTREIGIRKVLGASVQDILALLSRNFLRLIIVSALIAFPLAWLAMHAWLKEYACRVDLSWWIFLSGGIIALGIGVITISYQAIRAGMANPVNSLRAE